MGNSRNLDLKAIRQKAEALVAEKNITLPEGITPDLETVFQELSVHQIELEIQNEELRAIQQALESSHANYASLFNQAPCGYLILDTSGLVVKANQTFIDMLHLGKDDLREKAFVDFLTDASRPVFLGQYKAFFNHPEGKRINLEIKRPDGSFFYAAIFGSREVPESENQADKFQHIRIAVLDISEQRRAEIALAESYTKLNLRHQVAEIMLKFDDRMMYGQILTLLLDFFAAGSGFFAYLDEEQSLIMAALEGFRLPDLSAAKKNQDPHLNPEQWQDLWGKSLREKRSLYRNFNPELNEGESANIIAVPILHQGQLLGQICLKNRAGGFNQEIERNLNQVSALIAPVLAARLQRDREEKRRLETEEQLRQAERLESIGLMAGGVAHDLNNILAGIIGYPELLLGDLPQDSKLRKPIETIEDSGKRAATVVSDLLTVARGAASSKAVCDLNTLAQEYLASPECQKLKSLHAEVTCLHQFKAENALILASEVHVKKCIMNLVSNASEAISGEGTVTVTTYNTTVERTDATYKLKAGEYVVLSIRDTGSGIADKDLEHIFEPFYTRKVMGRSGTGLGLTVVWNTMEDHNGRVIVESSDQGTCFQLHFPVVAAPKEEIVSGKVTEDFVGNGEYILVVDDEPALRDITSRMLQSLGYKVDSVCSGELALKFLTDNKVDLLVLDMLMEPGMNGRETYEKVLEIHPDQKAIIASGFSESDEVKNVLQLGASKFIKKPYTKESLGRAVKVVLNS